MPARLRLVGACAALAVLLVACGGAPPPARAVTGLRAPDFPVLEATAGPVLVNFFANWCVPCRQEMPLLARRVAAAGGRYTVVAVDTHDDPSLVPGFLKGLGVSTGPGFRTATDTGGGLYRAYGLIGVPESFFLDRDHVLRRTSAGQLSERTLVEGLRAAGAG